MKTCLSIALFLLVAVLSAPSQAPAPGPIKTDICAISHHPEQFVGKRVVFHAEVLADGMHGALLWDNRHQCIVEFATQAAKQNQLSGAANRLLERAIFQGHPGTVDKRIQGTFAGLLLMERPGFGPPDRVKMPSLRLESLEHLQITDAQGTHDGLAPYICKNPCLLPNPAIPLIGSSPPRVIVR